MRRPRHAQSAGPAGNASSHSAPAPRENGGRNDACSGPAQGVANQKRGFHRGHNQARRPQAKAARPRRRIQKSNGEAASGKKGYPEKEAWHGNQAKGVGQAPDCPKAQNGSPLTEGPKRSDARLASAIPLKGDWANRASNPSNLTKRRNWGAVPASTSESKTWPNVGSLRSYPTKLLLGAYCGEAYDIRQAWQDLVGTTRHFVPPFFTFDIATPRAAQHLRVAWEGS